MGSTIAKEGLVFRYVGKAEECSSCEFGSICHNLTQGRRYRVTAVRDIEHECRVHDAGSVKVIEFEELPVEVAIGSRKALEGALVSLDEEECPKRWCPNHVICTRTIYPQGTKALIRKVEEDLECPMELKLKKAEVELK